MVFYYLGINQDTEGIDAVLFNMAWQVVARGCCAIELLRPRDGWVENNAEQVWEATQAAVGQALRKAGAEPRQIRSIGINHEGETVVMWNKFTGRPLYNSIVWRDQRTVHRCDQMALQYNNLVHQKTGLMIDSYFSAPKVQWILEHIPGAQEALESGALLAGSMGCWLVWKMTGGRFHITDTSSASRTLFFDVNLEEWCQDTTEIFGADPSILPTICDSAPRGVRTDPQSFLGIDAPIGGLLVDQQAALLGQGCTMPGAIKATYGNGCFLLMNTGPVLVQSHNGLLPTVAWQTKNTTTYALDGGVYTTGGAARWLSRTMGLMDDPTQSEQMAASVPDTGGVIFVPAFTGLAAPYWDSYARGMMIGLTAETTPAHLARATLEATAYQVWDLLDAMKKDAQMPIPVLRCHGRPAANRFMMQFQSDILGLPLEVSGQEEITALGAAFLGAISVGDYDSIDDIDSLWRCERSYEPQMTEERRGHLLYHWHRAVERAKYWSED